MHPFMLQVQSYDKPMIMVIYTQSHTSHNLSTPPNEIIKFITGNSLESFKPSKPGDIILKVLPMRLKSSRTTKILLSSDLPNGSTDGKHDGNSSYPSLTTVCVTVPAPECSKVTLSPVHTHLLKLCPTILTLPSLPMKFSIPL